MRRLLKWLAVAAAAVVVISAGLYLFVRSPYMQRLIKARVIAGVESRLNGRLTIARVSGNPLYGLSFHGVRLSSPEGEELFEAGRVRVTYFLPRLLLGGDDYRLGLAVADFHLNAVRGPEGTFNLQRMLKSPEGPPRARRVRLRRIRLRNGHVRVAFLGGEGQEHVREYIFDGLEARGAATIVTGRERDLSLRLERASFALSEPERLEVRRLSGSGRLKPGGLLSADLEVVTGASKVRLAFEAPGGESLRLAAKASPLALAEVSRFLPGLPPEGELTGKVALEGPRRAAQLAAELALGRATFEGSGTLDLGELGRPGYELRAALRQLDPAALSAAAQRAGLGGALNADVQLEGRGFSPAAMEARLRAKVLPSRVGKYEIRGAELAARLAGGALRLERGSAVFPFGRLRASGEVSDVTALRAGEVAARLQGEVAALNVGRLTGRPGLASDIGAEFRARLSRRPGQPLAATGSLELAEGSMLSGHRTQSGSLAWRLRGGRLEIDRLRLVSPLLELTCRGTLSRERLDLEYEAQAEDIGRLVQALRPEMQDASGRLALRGRLTGPPGSPDVEAQVKGSHVRYRTYSARRLTGSVTASGVRHLGRAAFSLRASGLSAGKRSLERLSAEGTYRNGGLEFDVAAVQGAERSLRLAGAARKITATSADLSLETVQLELPGLSVRNTGPLQGAVSKKGIRLSRVSLASTDGSLKLEGGLESAAALDLTLEFRGVRLSTLLPKGVPLKGRASGRLRLTGTVPEPRLTGEVTLAGAALTDVAGREIALERAEAEFRYGAGQLEVQALLVHEGNEVVAAGRVPLTLRLWPVRAELGRSGLELTLRAERLDLALLAATFGLKADVSGSLSATVTATGDPHQPELDGRAAVSGGAISAPGLPESFRNVEGQFAFNRDRLTIERLAADSDDGKLQLRGQIGLRGPMPLDLVVEARKFRVNIPEESWARVNADLSLTGTRLAPSVGGLIEVEEARIRVPERLTPSLREIRVVETLQDLEQERRQPEGVLPRLERNVAVEVGVVAPGRVRVIGRGLDAEFRLNLEAVKEREGRFRIVGTADAIRGTYTLRNKRLTIERAQALFKGLPSPDPDLSGRLTYEVQQTTVVVSVSGTLSKPQIALTSEPPLDQTDVYSYFLFGRPAAKLGRGEGRLLQQQVAGLVGGAAAQELTGILGPALDTFELTPAEGELGIEAITLGRYLTKDLFVTFERSFGVEAENRVRIDYRLSRRFSIESQFGSERTTGFDVFWNYDFSYLLK